MFGIRVVDLLVSLLSQSLVKIMHNQFSLSLISRVFRVLNLLQLLFLFCKFILCLFALLFSLIQQFFESINLHIVNTLVTILILINLLCLGYGRRSEVVW